MKLFKLFAYRPVVLPLAIAAAVTMVVISETAYWQSLGTLEDLVDTLQPQVTRSLAVHRDSLLQTLMLGRTGVAVLSIVSLLALTLLLRQGLALQQHQKMLHEVAQLAHDKLEAEVAQRTAELIELTHHLQTAREDERSHLARELHDELGSLLTAAKLDAARIRSRLAGTAPEALERLAHLVQALDQVIAFKRRITEDLHPSSLSHLGLVSTLEILAAEYAEASGTAVLCDLQAVPLSPAAEITVYRLVQEAINNISKYAQARHVWLSLQPQGTGVRLVVRDDGVGFDASVPRRSAYGLVGMRFRVQAEQGTLLLDTAPGKGTRIQVTLPVSGAAPVLPVPAASPAVAAAGGA